MALFRMLWIVVSSSSVSAENAQPCPKSYYCPGQTRQPVLCPVRHYCPEGRSEPLLCPPGHVCKGLGLEVFVDAAWGDVVPLAAGDLHTVVVSKSGQIWAAGYNQHGQLGTGGTVEQHAFVHVAVDGKKIMAVAAGGVHTAAITESGELWTWGNNWCGQVGVVLPMELHVPVKVSVNGQKIVAVAAGEVHTAAITDSGELWTWGPNKPGDVCIGGASVSGHVPVNVNVNDQPIVAVAAGRRHIVAITDSGELWTWGYNGHGQLGVGDTQERHAPVKVSMNGQKIVAVSAGDSHTAAITDSGELWTWGYNGHGQLGVGDTMKRHSPVKTALTGKIGKLHDPLCWSIQGWESSALGEAFLAATWGSQIPVPRQCSALHDRLAAFLQKCRVQVGAWEATPCPAGSFCPKVGACSAGVLDGGAQQCPAGFFCTQGAVTPTPCKAGLWCPPGSTGPRGSEGVGDTAWDFRGTEALDIWRGLMIVFALAAGSFSVFVGVFGCSRCSSPVTQYDHRGRRVLKIRSPNISIHDVSVRHFGLRVEVDLGHRAAKPLQTRLRSSFVSFEFRPAETVMEDGFLYLHFAESAERRYEFPAPDGGSSDASEGTENSFEYVALGEEEVNGASV